MQKLPAVHHANPAYPMASFALNPQTLEILLCRYLSEKCVYVNKIDKVNFNEAKLFESNKGCPRFSCRISESVL